MASEVLSIVRSVIIAVVLIALAIGLFMGVSRFVVARGGFGIFKLTGSGLDIAQVELFCREFRDQLLLKSYFDSVYESSQGVIRPLFSDVSPEKHYDAMAHFCSLYVELIDARTKGNIDVVVNEINQDYKSAGYSLSISPEEVKSLAEKEDTLWKEGLKDLLVEKVKRVVG